MGREEKVSTVVSAVVPSGVDMFSEGTSDIAVVGGMGVGGGG